MTISENIARVREQIAEAAHKAGRRPEEITLVAASKMNDAERVREAISAGITDVGENRVQELMQKNAENAYQGARLHYIGHLQSNKVRQVVGVCDLIQSVSSLPLLQLIHTRAESLGLVQEVLVEVNIGREEDKSGVLKEELEPLFAAASDLRGVRVVGLMAIPPVSGNLSGNRVYFDEMYHLFVDIRQKKYDNISMNLLSMGMSDSFAEAIEAGATMVRVGSAIFGQRQYQ